MDKSSSIGLKIIIIGDTSTGKTSIVTKYIYNKFSESYKATIVSQFDFKIIKYKDQIYRLQFWDLAGQDRSPEMTKLFCQDTNGVIICCEVNKKESRDNTLKWKENLINNRIDIKKITLVLCENKCDLLNDNYENFQELKNFSINNEFNQCFRTSALNGFGIEDMILFIVEDIVNRNNNNNNNEINDTFKIQKNKETTNQDNNLKKSCC
jgi:Ras-related protein Rab-6A